MMKYTQSKKQRLQAPYTFPATFAIIALFGIFAPIRARALDVSIMPYVEANSGDAREYVYTDDKILSELIWDMKPMVSVGAAINAGWTDGLRISAGASAGIPMRTGSMQDSDWLNIDINGSDKITTYSKHDAELEFAYQAKIETGWEFSLPVFGPASSSRVSLVPTLGFRFMNWKWNGNDGYVQHLDESGYPSLPGGVYRDWNEDVTKKPATGTVISYQQQFWMPTAGLTVIVPVASYFRVGLGCTGTLWTSCYALDMHFYPKANWDFSQATEKKQFFDLLSSGWMIEPELRLEWTYAKPVTLQASGSWRKISGLRGDTRYLANGALEYETSTRKSGGGGGAALEALTFRLGAEVQLSGLIRHNP